MSDIALVWDPVNGRADFAMNAAGTDLLMDDTPATAVIISLFSDRLADAADVIPDGTTDPRGWWGDTPLPNETDPSGGQDLTGSKIWLRFPGLQITENLRKVESDAKAALQWGIDDGVWTSVSATAFFPATPANAMFLTIAIVLANGTPWSNTFSIPRLG
jgi:phage gp46-like protein